MPVAPRPRRWHLGVAFAAVATLVAGPACSGSDDAGADTTTTAAERAPGDALTEDDVERLAQALYANFRAGGAGVRATVDHTADRTVTVEGEVDWTEHRGALTVTSSRPDGPPVVEDLRFTGDAVYDPIAARDADALARAGREGVEWVVRTPDPSTRPIDQVVDLLVSLAATRPDNPQLVAQRGLRFDGRETVDGRPTDVYASSTTGATYWLDADDDRLVRFQGTLPGFAGPIVVDLSGHGPVEVDVPAPEVTVEAADLPDG